MASGIDTWKLVDLPIKPQASKAYGGRYQTWIKIDQGLSS